MSQQEVESGKRRKGKLWEHKWMASVGLALMLTSLAALYFVCQEPSEVREQKAASKCYVSLQLIAVAMERYTQREGNLHYPPNLEVLLHLGYLHSPAIITCGGEPYFYVGDARKDMPANLPLVIERNAPHVFRYPEGETVKYGQVLYADMSLHSLPELHVSWNAQQAQRALEIMNQGDAARIVAVLKNPPGHTSLEQAAALWKWRQEPGMISHKVLEEYLEFLLEGRLFSVSCAYESDLCDGKISPQWHSLFNERKVRISEDAIVQTKMPASQWVIKDPHITYTVIKRGDALHIHAQILHPDPYYRSEHYPLDPRPALRQALYLWHSLNGAPAMPEDLSYEKNRMWQIFLEELYHPNYFVRKNNWRILFPSCRDFPLEILSPEAPLNLERFK